MASTVKYRKYNRSTPSAERAADNNGPSPSSPDADDDDTTATTAVPFRNGEGTLTEVRALVRSGDLHLFDLVDVGRGWESVGECAELQENSGESTPRRTR